MFLSRVMLNLTKLTPDMWLKWQSIPSYASHQWLWQLFSQQQERRFLFRHESTRQGECFYVLSDVRPLHGNGLFTVESKSFSPQLSEGMMLTFALRANPVVTRKGKRSDVMMDAKYHAKEQGVDSEEYQERQISAATEWLRNQGEKSGFFADSAHIDVTGSQRHRFVRRTGERPVSYTSVDFTGSLTVTDVPLFMRTLNSGLGKSKALGCGLMLIRRG